jgi:hypothetical protein
VKAEPVVVPVIVIPLAEKLTEFPEMVPVKVSGPPVIDEVITVTGLPLAAVEMTIGTVVVPLPARGRLRFQFPWVTGIAVGVAVGTLTEVGTEI